MAVIGSMNNKNERRIGGKEDEVKKRMSPSLNSLTQMILLLLKRYVLSKKKISLFHLAILHPFTLYILPQVKDRVVIDLMQRIKN